MENLKTILSDRTENLAAFNALISVQTHPFNICSDNITP